MNALKSRHLIGMGLGVATILMAGCSSQTTQHQSALEPKMQSHMNALKVQKLRVSLLTQQLKMENAQIDQRNKQMALVSKSIPALTAASDDALRTAQSFQMKASASTDAKQKKQLIGKANSAQKVADDKAGALLAARGNVRTLSNQVRDLRVEIQKLTAQKQTAERLAKSESSAIAQLEKSSQTQSKLAAKQQRLPGAEREGSLVMTAGKQPAHVEPVQEASSASDLRAKPKHFALRGPDRHI